MEKPGVAQSMDNIAGDVHSMIFQTREEVTQFVNSGTSLIYWRIGKRIQTEVLGYERAKYCKELLQTLTAALIPEYGQGYSQKNQHYIATFVNIFAESGNVSALTRQTGWSHFKDLVSRDQPLQRGFYGRIERWGVRTLRAKIGSMLYERIGIWKKPEQVPRAEIAALHIEDRLAPELDVRDAYILDCPGLSDHYLEKHLKSSEADTLWNLIVEMNLIAAPSLPHPEAFEMDCAMQDGAHRVNERAAVGSVLMHWNVDCTEDHSLKESKSNIWLKNRQAQYGVESIAIAPGYRQPNEQLEVS